MFSTFCVESMLKSMLPTFRYVFNLLHRWNILSSTSSTRFQHVFNKLVLFTGFYLFYCTVHALQAIREMASSATKVLTSIANKPNKTSANEDNDWTFCQFIYPKLKVIPEGDLKEELQLDIQKLISCARKQVTGQHTTRVADNGCAPLFPMRYGCHPEPMMHGQSSWSYQAQTPINNPQETPFPYNNAGDCSTQSYTNL
jgi:hypothetical protein